MTRLQVGIGSFELRRKEYPCCSCALLVVELFELQHLLELELLLIEAHLGTTSFLEDLCHLVWFEVEMRSNLKQLLHLSPHLCFLGVRALLAVLLLAQTSSALDNLGFGKGVVLVIIRCCASTVPLRLQSHRHLLVVACLTDVEGLNHNLVVFIWLATP